MDLEQRMMDGPLAWQPQTIKVRVKLGDLKSSLASESQGHDDVDSKGFPKRQEFKA